MEVRECEADPSGEGCTTEIRVGGYAAAAASASGGTSRRGREESMGQGRGRFGGVREKRGEECRGIRIDDA